MNTIAFVSYRREDSSAEAKLIADAARRVLHSDSVFIDTRAIQSGEPWPDRLRAALESAAFVLVIIGPKWLTAGANEWGQRRIDDKSDWVRLEVASALADSGKIVIPILVDGAKMPPAPALPDPIAGLCSRQYIEIRRDCWDHDVILVTSRLAPPASGIASTPSAPSPLVAPFWSNLSPDLQDAFALAAVAATREGKTIISTRTLFAALRRLNPEPLREFFEQVPPGALPNPVAAAVPPDASALAAINSFSSCVQESLGSLSSLTSQQTKLAAEDIFVDIARHGTGRSVRQLRASGIDGGRVDGLVRQLGWRLIERAA